MIRLGHYRCNAVKIGVLTFKLVVGSREVDNGGIYTKTREDTCDAHPIKKREAAANDYK